MALTLTYGDLKAQVLTLLKERCKNIDSNSNIDASLKSGWAVNHVIKGTAGDGASVYARVSSNDTWTNVRTSTEVNNAFDSYMTTCGVNAKSLQTITYRGLINFLSCVYRFLADHILVIYNEYTGAWDVVYYPMRTSSTVGSIAETNIVTATDVDQYIEQLTRAYANNNLNKTVSMSLSYDYISSSSSSSSNCSSSMFIAYMNLDI